MASQPATNSNPTRPTDSTDRINNTNSIECLNPFNDPTEGIVPILHSVNHITGPDHFKTRLLTHSPTLFAAIANSTLPGSSIIAVVAHRIDSRRGLLGADPAFAQAFPSPAPSGQSLRQEEYPQQSPYPPKPKAKMFDFIATKWPRMFFGVAFLQLIICLVIEGYTFAQFHIGTNDNDLCDDASNDSCEADREVSSQFKTISTFLVLFIFGFIYELILVWDALRMKNTIQVIIICIANFALLVFSALQTDQIKGAINIIKGDDVDGQSRLVDGDLWADVQPFLIALPCVIALCSLIMCGIAWKLYQEFAWDILKHIGADYRMKKRFLHYQVYIALLKFDFFFFLGFTVQFLVIVNNKDFELGLTIAAIPFCIGVLVLAAFFTRRENKPGVIIIIGLYLAALAYFFFKLVRIYQKGYAELYMPVRKSLTAFAVLTIILIILTIINAFVCMHNFNAGLKRHLLGPRGPDLEKPDLNSIDLNTVKPQLPSRMTID
ncbi:hypothetical protein MKZ38_007875 [Zalerion maritima]|uniref:Uncharacterized protein n=1 Tax=Zalerion maritima TaxID=339359 RepID=A0AAD5RW97_9PEZI|nr:hypothetical protein MKZ38_007875 [Zalerion maritima]